MGDDETDGGAYEWGSDFGALLNSVPGVAELQDAGFTPVETLFGEHHLATRWPEEHRRELRDTRFAQTGGEPLDENELRLFLVRSPWPAIELPTVVRLMFRWLRRNAHSYQSDSGQHFARVDTAAELEVVDQFFRQSEPRVRAYSRGRINRLA